MEKQDLYVLEIGSVIKKRKESFLISNNGNNLKEISSRKIKRIFLVGKQSITPDAMEYALDKEIDVFFIAKSGRIKGSLISKHSKNIFLRLAQYNVWCNREEKLKIAKFFVIRKIVNQSKLLGRYNIRVSEYEWKVKAKRAKTLNEVLGIEGEFSKKYFSYFDDIIKSDLKFEKRSRRPAKNEFNSLLNLTYTMTKNNILNKLELEGFECYIGFLHGVKYGRESLALDVIEEIRASCDRIIIKWVNRGEFRKVDFLKSEDGIVLSEKSFRKYIEKYSKEYSNSIESEINVAIKEFRKILLDK
ncbi:CRISPR-associated endonuclease Cas1 [Clostridium perfringens]|uniref:CRISPR-associated endonuclease Cas1 n=1 Tax=Clostridium perfringens TaxID=1502 RepID=UPI0018E46FDA|nr:CRISPR-associated endonuclease Cas1 [Clostridium perfringens]MBI5999310.1 CRISPR-associated endonuclease Cas1 [Clostridium perfringens]MDK0567204.1 CRISPR-associated endonuclease Cas1 [Clostridium perfringens]MDK0573192.1 CRISPR-associated endonuclease Cas1 [Clostridium perfringens]MDK0982674.1 CRISPR-associated endonuclease Cas1 [Clostridium perfringens]